MGRVTRYLPYLVVGPETGARRTVNLGQEARKVTRFARPSTSGLTLSKHPFGTTLVPRINVPNITLISLNYFLAIIGSHIFD